MRFDPCHPCIECLPTLRGWQEGEERGIIEREREREEREDREGGREGEREFEICVEGVAFQKILKCEMVGECVRRENQPQRVCTLQRHNQTITPKPWSMLTLHVIILLPLLA